MEICAVQLPGREDPKHLAAFAPALRDDLSLAEGYFPSAAPQLACPITTVVGADDIGMSSADLDGWSVFTKDAFDCTELPGDHFALLRIAAIGLGG